METTLQNDTLEKKNIGDSTETCQEKIAKALQYVTSNPKELVKAAARTNLLVFSRYMQPSLDIQPFHKMYYHILNEFAHGRIKKLIITMPPQHGKSEGSSRKLPAFLAGLFPDKKIFIGSYAATHAQDFNRDVQKIIDTPEYRELFPETFLARSTTRGSTTTYQRNSNVIEFVGRKGSLRTVGRGGALTGKSVDISILDDIYKDYEEANSPVIRESAWKWYTTVVQTRLDNNSQEIIVYTRWHSDDVVGRLEEKETIIDITKLSDLQDIPDEAWVRINFPAIKTGEPTELDPREFGTSLWEGKHSLKKLMKKRKLDKVQFECLYQGEPGSAAGKLYNPFKTYVDWKEYGTLVAKGNYTDCADEGTDFLCSVCYNKVVSREAKDENGNPVTFICITDVVHTDEPIEVTTRSVPMMLNRECSQYANIESNNGGKAFAKIVEPKTRTLINWFTQTSNKESRIISNAGLVNYHIIMPFDWETRFPTFYSAVTNFLRKFKANSHDDAPDVLTGIIEKEILNKTAGIKRKN